MIWSSSITTSSKVTLAVLESRCPSLSSGLPVTILPPQGSGISRQACDPVSAVSGSTASAGTTTQAMKGEEVLPTLEKTVNCEAKEAFVMKHFCPLSRYFPFFSFRMRVVMPLLSEPALGSVRQKEARSGRSTKGARKARCCSSVPCIAITTFARSLHMADVAIPLSP